ncbi:restriction endonuclease [bacterium]|nr:restriction endonuclease [bacterium]
MRGQLFTQQYLLEGIRETGVWKSITDDDVERFRAFLIDLFGKHRESDTRNEAETEHQIIIPILKALGWHYLPQQSATPRGRRKLPDLLLFDDDAKLRAAQNHRHESERYAYGLCVAESKRWNRPLDRADDRDTDDTKTPSNQILAYLARVAVIPGSRIEWGILSNGRHWRLYWQKAYSQSEEFFDIDLAIAAGAAGFAGDLFDTGYEDVGDALRLFIIVFRPASFFREGTGARSFLEEMQAEGRLWERKIAQDLGEHVFHKLYPDLLNAIAERAPAATLDEVRHAALIFLYRLLFVFYAEDRDLLPVKDERYEHYSLRRIRHDVAERVDRGEKLSGKLARYDRQLRDLFRAIAHGDTEVGLPAYNGGLFDDESIPERARVEIPDSVLIKIIDRLSRHRDTQADGDARSQWINYRDLSVRHLGSVYERLLEFVAYRQADRKIGIRPNKFARKDTGSYYTADDLVKLVVKEAVGPLIAERMHVFEVRAQEMTSSRASVFDRLSHLQEKDAADAILRLKVCDPAMGSGHFLVALVDYLADEIIRVLGDAAGVVHKSGERYVSPVEKRIRQTRQRILDHARDEGWRVEASQLDDRHLVRRMILKSVVHGVDKNPMAVELAKVALWLHTFTVGAPLSFLDHHLHCGDSLFGEWMSGVVGDMEKVAPLFASGFFRDLARFAPALDQISEIADADLTEVNTSRTLYAMVEDKRRPYWRLADLWQGLRWLESGADKDEQKRVREGRKQLLDRASRLAEAAERGYLDANGRNGGDNGDAMRNLNELLARALSVADDEHFFHWEFAFPSIWKIEQNFRVPDGGFDAVVGNPPWDRMKIQEVEWFAIRAPEIAKQARAADRKKLVAEMKEARNPLALEYEEARRNTESAMRLARSSGEYDLLANGDMNLYSLFVERAARLVKPTGIVGLLTPSGIASDKSAANFFRTISTNARLSALFDFENRDRKTGKEFFPDVDTRFKFCALIFGGETRKFNRVRCAFFLHRVEEIDEAERVFELTPADFALVNPNTATAPIFREQRDAAITTRIYREHPVLVDRREDEPKYLYPIKYLTMFHMTNDSHLFMTKDELQAMHVRRFAGNQWKKGKKTWSPLYEGKMVQMYDHRAANVIVNPENVHRPANAESATDEQHRNPSWLPTPQFWVAESEIPVSKEISWFVGFKEITAPTNARTMIAAVIPRAAVGNTLPLLLPSSDAADTGMRLLCMLANMNSFAFDFVARQKVQGQHLNLYIVEQLPFIAPETYAAFTREDCDVDVAAFVRDEVVRLSYTSVDLKDFAAEFGVTGEPFAWNEEDRRHRMARLDALYFLLYGISHDDAKHILDKFPIVRAQDEARYDGWFRTRDLIEHYMSALDDGDFEVVVTPGPPQKPFVPKSKRRKTGVARGSR